jgi:hypothetical protein
MLASANREGRGVRVPLAPPIHRFTEDSASRPRTKAMRARITSRSVTAPTCRAVRDDGINRGSSASDLYVLAETACQRSSSHTDRSVRTKGRPARIDTARQSSSLPGEPRLRLPPSGEGLTGHVRCPRLEDREPLARLQSPDAHAAAHSSGTSRTSMLS